MSEAKLVRATIHFGGLRLGDIVPVDPEDPYIAERIRSGLLAPVNPADPPPGTEATSDPGEDAEAASDEP